MGNPIALKKKLQKNANFKQKTTNLNLTYFPIIMSIYISIIMLYLIGQNFCKKQNKITKQIFIMALQKIKSRQKTFKRKTENYFSVDETKKDNNQNLYLKITKKYWKKILLATLF